MSTADCHDPIIIVVVGIVMPHSGHISEHYSYSSTILLLHTTEEVAVSYDAWRFHVLDTKHQQITTDAMVVLRPVLLLLWPSSISFVVAARRAPAGQTRGRSAAASPSLRVHKELLYGKGKPSSKKHEALIISSRMMIRIIPYISGGLLTAVV